jgi:cell division initiation protein
MKLTPIDITHKSFNKKMFGLDEAEVSDFLQAVASTMEGLIHERNTLKEMLREREIQVQEYKEKDNVLKSTIATASQMAERMRQDGDREARLIISDAQQKAEMIMRDSRDSLKKMYQEITDLKRVRMQFEANLKALAQAHLAIVEQGDKYMPSIGLPNVNLETENGNMQAQMNQTRSTQISPLSAR